MLIKRASDIRSSEITDKKLYLNRREFIRAAGVAAGAAAGAGVFGAAERRRRAAEPAPHGRKLENVKPSPLSVTEREAEHLGADHHLQQLLRVRHRQGIAVALREVAEDRAVEGRRRRRVRQAGATTRSRTS